MGPCPILWAAKNTIKRRIDPLPGYPINGGFFGGAGLLPTNLLDMMEDTYLEDGQLAAPKEIVDIVEKFGRDQDIHRSSHYNQLRTQFINPFFEALA